MSILRLSPSDFAWLYDACPRCFWHKCHGKRAPREKLPPIFSKIDALMKDAIGIPELQHLGFEIDRAAYGLTWVESKPLRIRSTDVVIAGKPDACFVLKSDGLLVVDYKTSAESTASSIWRYSRQLHGYACAIKNAKERCAYPVESLALVPLEPKCMRVADDDVFLLSSLKRIDVPIDWNRFFGWLSHVVELVECENAPPASDYCDICAYVKELSR